MHLNSARNAAVQPPMAKKVYIAQNITLFQNKSLSQLANRSHFNSNKTSIVEIKESEKKEIEKKDPRDYKLKSQNSQQMHNPDIKSSDLINSNLPSPQPVRHSGYKKRQSTKQESPLIYQSFSPQLVEHLKSDNSKVLTLQFKNQINTCNFPNQKLEKINFSEQTTAVEIKTDKIFIRGPKTPKAGNKFLMMKSSPSRLSEQTLQNPSVRSFIQASPGPNLKKISLNDQTQNLSNQVMDMISNLKKHKSDGNNYLN